MPRGPAATSPRCVLITDGGAAVRCYQSGGGHAVPRVDVVAVPTVDVVDTVGAGDSFGGAFLAWWTRAGLGRDDLGDPAAVGEATRAAVRAAAITCTRRGADPRPPKT